MSMQELSVIKHYRIPVNIFIINNSGYSMIKQTQDQWMSSNYVGSDSSKHLTFSFKKIADGFGFDYFLWM